MLQCFSPTCSSVRVIPWFKCCGGGEVEDAALMFISKVHYWSRLMSHHAMGSKHRTLPIPCEYHVVQLIRQVVQSFLKMHVHSKAPLHCS